MEKEPSSSALPEPSVDPPEPSRPDAIDTWSPGLTDESGDVQAVEPQPPDRDRPDSVPP